MRVQLTDVPAVQAKGLLVLVHKLPESPDLQVTAINFGPAPVDETVAIAGAPQNSSGADVLDPKSPALAISAAGGLRLSLKGYEGKKRCGSRDPLRPDHREAPPARRGPEASRRYSGFPR